MLRWRRSIPRGTQSPSSARKGEERKSGIGLAIGGGCGWAAKGQSGFADCRSSTSTDGRKSMPGKLSLQYQDVSPKTQPAVWLPANTEYITETAADDTGSGVVWPA